MRKLGQFQGIWRCLRIFLKKIGSPHEKLKNVIHIVGTKGKGSVSFLPFKILNRFRI